MEEFSKELISLGHALANTGRERSLDLRGLKRLKDYSLLPFLSKTEGSRKRFFAFFLINFLDDVFYNLVGDFPYEDSYGEKTHELRKDFFVLMGSEFCKIGEILATGDLSHICEYFEALVAMYLDKIDEINEVIAESQ